MELNGYSRALMGFDFADADTLELAREKFTDYLIENGVDQKSAKRDAFNLNRAWEFATYAYCHIDYHKPEAAWILGKSFMLHHMPSWRGLMDMRPGSPHLRIFEKYMELRERRYHLPGEHDYQRSLSKFEKRVDFAAIERIFDEDALKVDLEIRAEIKKTLKRIIEQIEQRAKTGGLNEQFVLALQVDTGTGIPRILGQYLTDVWRRGRDLALRELPEPVKKQVETVKRFELGLAECIYCKKALFHLPGQHDQCDHSVTGECVDKEWQKITEDMTADKLNKIPHGTRDELERIPRIILRVRSDAKNLPAFLHGSKTGVFYALKTKDGWLGFQRNVKTGDFLPQKHLFKPEDYELITEETKKLSVRIFAGLEPTQAINFLQNLRPWLIKGIIDDELKKTTRLELSEHLKGGRTLTETIGNLRSDFEPFVGDPEKIIPSGPGIPAAENILQAFRLENIIRTETNGALNIGRANVAEEVGDFILGFSLSAVLDLRTTLVCQEADGKTFPKGHALAIKLQPNLHWQCRTILVYVTSDDVPVTWSSDEELNYVVSLIPKGFK